MKRFFFRLLLFVTLTSTSTLTCFSATSITTRASKGSALTHAEMDANFNNLKATADAALVASQMTGAVLPFPTTTAPTGWLALDGTSKSRATYANLYAVIGLLWGKVITVDTGTDIFTSTAHGYSTTSAITVDTQNTLPSPLVKDTIYYVRSLSADTFSLHPTATDATNNTNKINITTAGTGQHTVWESTTFPLVDMRGEFVRGWDNARGIDTNRIFGSWQADSMQGHFHNFNVDGTVRSSIPKTASAGGGTVQFAQGTSGSTTNTTIDSAISDGTNGTPRTAAETRPRSIALLYCIHQ